MHGVENVVIARGNAAGRPTLCTSNTNCIMGVGGTILHMCEADVCQSLVKSGSWHKCLPNKCRTMHNANKQFMVDAHSWGGGGRDI